MTFIGNRAFGLPSKCNFHKSNCYLVTISWNQNEEGISGYYFRKAVA